MVPAVTSAYPAMWAIQREAKKMCTYLSFTKDIFSLIRFIIIKKINKNKLKILVLIRSEPADPLTYYIDIESHDITLLQCWNPVHNSVNPF